MISLKTIKQADIKKWMKKSRRELATYNQNGTSIRKDRKQWKIRTQKNRTELIIFEIELKKDDICLESIRIRLKQKNIVKNTTKVTKPENLQFNIGKKEEQKLNPKMN